ncbi:stAR-related lipid transfer protein 6 [Heteronotia binoei]|uniref:stAR-related lipid transfer protein 6 n=1 Tax=Heteronotia binoei TaxID=13085 RepID=UPI00292EE12D|nr:stAR-related lipid transfer protein 6 [Heteronotia binoei]
MLRRPINSVFRPGTASGCLILETERKDLKDEQICTLTSGPPPSMDYKKLSEEISKKMLPYLKDASGWKQIKKGKLITVSMRPSTDYLGNTYRVEATIEQLPEKVFPFIYLPEYRAKWDKSLQSYKVVDTIDQDTAIYHSITHSYGFGLVPPRDFVYMVHIKKYNGILTTNSTSVNHPKCPPCQSYIRGQAYPSGFACSPSPENPQHCKMVAVIQVDLGGKLLPSVIQSVMPTSLVNLITDIRAGIKKLK